MTSGAATTWRSWSGLTVAHPRQVVTPRDVDEVADAVRVARANRMRLRMVGSGHSFTDVAATDGLMLRPERLAGVRAVDREAMTVTVWSGTTLHDLNAALAGLGLSLHNMGDIDRQTVAGAVATGTHGSGGVWASLSAQVAGVELVTGEGSLLAVDEADPDLLDAVRVSLGALGVMTAVTFRVEPAFRLHAEEGPLSWDELVGDFDRLVDEHDHVDVHWMPYTDRALCKRNDRTLDPEEPLSRARAFVERELVENRAIGLLNRAAERTPRAVPTLNRWAMRAVSARRHTDATHRVLVAERKVRFRETEYAVPRYAGMAALTEVRALLERHRWPVALPVEIRTAPADSAFLSTAHERPSTYLAVHVSARTDHREIFREVEAVMRAHDGRPHWGKLHGRTAEDLAPGYPRWADFAAVRDRLDPDRVFANDHLDRVLGP